jgi:putative ABC transport system permease protein
VHYSLSPQAEKTISIRDEIALWGCLLGLALSWPVTRSLRSVLFGITAEDMFSWLAAPAVLALVALGSCLAPARRAARADPAAILKTE